MAVPWAVALAAPLSWGQLLAELSCQGGAAGGRHRAPGSPSQVSAAGAERERLLLSSALSRQTGGFLGSGARLALL